MAHATYAFLNGDIVPFEDAKVHIGTGIFKFGSGVFEGLRGYWNDDHQQMYVFRLDEHMRRLVYSQRFMRFEEIVDPDYLAEQTLALIRANELRETIHIMTTVFINGFGPPTVCGPVGCSITTTPGVSYRFAEKGCSVQVSSWQRVADTAMPMRVKCNANYQNGRIAAIQARADGYDTALFLNSRGKVSEGPGMCFFMVRDNKVITPTLNNDILESITRDSVLELLSSACGMTVEERDIDRSELVAADEAFFCGTAWEITPIVNIDKLPLADGKVGPIVSEVSKVFTDVVNGRNDNYAKWCTAVYPPAQAKAV